MTSEPAALLARHPPGRWTRPLPRRARADLPFDAEAVAPDDRIMLDATVYVDALKAPLPMPVARLLSTRVVMHSAVALGELAVAVGRLDPADPRTATNVAPIIDTLSQVAPAMIVAPSADAWIEGMLIAGIVARVQAHPPDERRRLVNDALILLSAAETGAVLISRNVRDVDRLLQLRPDARVLLYDRDPPAASTGPGRS